jgi:hypothetical protein
MKRFVILTVTHALAIAVGFALGIYFLPILVAPKAPMLGEVRALADAAQFNGEFRRGLKGSDLLHWGEGYVFVGKTTVSLAGTLAPGPDYKLYLSPEFVDTKEGFLRVKGRSLRLGDVKTFDNFIVRVPESVDPSRYNTVVVWCETFSMFISAAKYR